jgi:hypothetical protein
MDSVLCGLKICCFYGEIVAVDEKGIISVKDGLDGSIRYFGACDHLFETEKEAKDEFWLPEGEVA